MDGDKLAELRGLLFEAIDHVMACGECGYGKSSDGAVSISWPSRWSAEPGGMVEIFLYCLSLGGKRLPYSGGRRSYYANIDDALDAVREMHAEEMAIKHGEACHVGW